MGSFYSKFQVFGFTKPWRTINWHENEDELTFLKRYKPQSEDRTIRILLYGPAGAGKSSFINSVQSVLHGRTYSQALVDNTSGDSFTEEYITHKIQKKNGSLYPFIFNDVMGLSKDKGVLKEDLESALKGRVKEGYKFSTENRLSEGDPFYNKNPSPNDQVQVLVCVIPADKISIMDEVVRKKIREVRIQASKLHIAQVAIITKIDRLCPEIKRDVRNVYKLKTIKEKMEKFSIDVGIPMNCIFPVKNYHEEIHMNDEMDSLILSATRHIVNCGDDCINFHHNRSESS